MTKHGFLILLSLLLSPVVLSAADTVAFPSGEITLHGALYKPEGTGPFPAVVYNHGSAAGMLSKEAFDALGPVFASHGWVFFGPYRRGQGLSASAGPYIGDQIAAAEKNGGISAGAAAMVRLLETDHLESEEVAAAHCLITDVRMTGMDGLELQRRVNLLRPKLPIIFISAHYDEEIRQRALHGGARAFLYKPFDAVELLSLVKQAVDEFTDT